jgi:hypothetical protein
LEVAALLEFNQQRATGHVLELAGGVAPVPRLTQSLREAPPAPVGVIDEELTDLSQFGGTQLSALEQQTHTTENGRKKNRSPVRNEKI